jgi:glycogen synthase
MRVLFWSELFWPYIRGIELSGVELLPALRERGYESIVVTSHNDLDLPDAAQYKNIPIFRFPFRLFWAAATLIKWCKCDCG